MCRFRERGGLFATRVPACVDITVVFFVLFHVALVKFASALRKVQKVRFETMRLLLECGSRADTCVWGLVPLL